MLTHWQTHKDIQWYMHKGQHHLSEHAFTRKDTESSGQFAEGNKIYLFIFQLGSLISEPALIASSLAGR